MSYIGDEMVVNFIGIDQPIQININEIKAALQQYQQNTSKYEHQNMIAAWH